jgi:hypothetical protein
LSVIARHVYVKRNKLSDGTDTWDIDIHEHASNIFRYLINTSRVHWRKDLEYSLDHLDDEDAGKYRLEHLFDIAGPNLDPAEIVEQKQNLINKIFAIGYILHRYKSPSRAWSPYAMDNKLERTEIATEDLENHSSSKPLIIL